MGNSRAVPLHHLVGALDRLPVIHQASSVEALAHRVSTICQEQGAPVPTEVALRVAQEQLASVTLSPSPSPSFPSSRHRSWIDRCRQWFIQLPEDPIDYQPESLGSRPNFPLVLEKVPPTLCDQRRTLLSKWVDGSAMVAFLAFFLILPIATLAILHVSVAVPLSILALIGTASGILGIFFAYIRKRQCPPRSIFNNATMMAKHKYALALGAFDRDTLIRALRASEVTGWCKDHTRAHLNAHFPGWSLTPQAQD